VVFDGPLPPTLEKLAQALAVGRETVLPLARDAAVARYNLERILAGKAFLQKCKILQLKERLPSACETELAGRAAAELADEFRKIEDYERRHRSRLRKILKQLGEA
jgi:hypothetical protein